MISVIVPVYNTEKYLDRCIQSILSQTYTDFELLLIDDGSTDSSGAICDRYAEQDSRFRVFHKPNGGVSSARNLGLDNVKGEWVAFVDSDDIVLPEFLTNYIDINSDSDLLVQGITPNYSVNSEYIISKTSFDYNGNIQEGVIRMNKCQMFGSLCNKLFKFSIISTNELRLNKTFRYREDEEFLLRYMSMVKTVAATSRVGYVYLVPNLSKYKTSYNLPVLKSMYESVVKIYDGKANNITDFYQAQLFQEWISELAVDCCRAVKFVPQILNVVGLRIFRLAPLKVVAEKIYGFIRKA